MAKKRPVVAIMYDFDGTLAPGNMQEYNFIPKLKMKSEEFWNECKELSKKNEMDMILAYMFNMLKRANENRIAVKRKTFFDYGKGLPLYKGVKDWFERINEYGMAKGANIQHYVISSGLKEMIEGTPIVKNFKETFASYFYYDHNEIAVWPAVALNYTSKTQFLFRINKGCLDISDDTMINKYIENEKRAIKFENMIFIGDGETDVPCMKLVKVNGGCSIAVYKPRTRKGKALELIDENRVDFVAPADYSEGKRIEKIVKSVIDKILAVEKLNDLKISN